MKTIKQMESEIKRLKKQAKRINDRLFDLDCKLHDAKVDAEKLRLAKQRIKDETPKYRKKKYAWPPRGVEFENDLDVYRANIVVGPSAATRPTTAQPITASLAGSTIWADGARNGESCT